MTRNSQAALCPRLPVLEEAETGTKRRSPVSPRFLRSDVCMEIFQESPGRSAEIIMGSTPVVFFMARSKQSKSAAAIARSSSSAHSRTPRAPSSGLRFQRLRTSSSLSPEKNARSASSMRFQKLKPPVDGTTGTSSSSSSSSIRMPFAFRTESAGSRQNFQSVVKGTWSPASGSVLAASSKGISFLDQSSLAASRSALRRSASVERQSP